ncbi:hypothetical protein ACA910_006383 [Epithemia clementina (nom. ined.)]
MSGYRLSETVGPRPDESSAPKAVKSAATRQNNTLKQKQEKDSDPTYLANDVPSPEPGIKATKADDAEVPEYLWSLRIEAGLSRQMSPGDFSLFVKNLRKGFFVSGRAK